MRPTTEDDLYPDSDGRASDSDRHRELLASLTGQLDHRYSADPMVYVSGWLFIYYEEGNPAKRVAPDVFVVPGAAKKARRHFLTWRERATPSVVIELTSTRTCY